MTGPVAAPDASPDGPDGVDEAGPGRALRTLALPLVAAIARLREATPADPAALRRSLAAAVARFEADARVAGVDEPTIAAASYVLCAWGDEQFAAAPWGAQGAGLLQRFHGEAGGDKLLRLLGKLAARPREHRALLELAHACLSLGLRAGPGLDPRAHDALRSRVYLALQPVAPVPPLAASWQCAPAAASPPRAPRTALPGLLLLGVLALGVYTASQVLLAARVDDVSASLQRLVPAPPAHAAAAGAPSAPAAARLAPQLRDDVATGRLSVRDEPLRSVVVVPADALRDAAAPLQRVAAALARVRGKVLVVGYTDGGDAPTARTPSGWHQAMDWARQAADTLRPQVGDARLAIEARVDPAGAPPPRRIEIILFPE